MEEEKRTEENSTVEKKEPTLTTTESLIQEIERLKSSTIKKEEYDKLADDNRQLIKALVDGNTLGKQEDEKPIDIELIRKELFQENNNLTNLEYAKKALELREGVMKEGKPDPFLPYGSSINPTEEDKQTSEKVATALENCIEYAQGDSEAFTNELQRIMIDSKPNYRR